MKALTTFIAALAAVACVSIAQADTTVRFTGSTAFRLNTVNAILHIYDPGVTYGYTGTSFTGASFHIFHGVINGQTVHIKTAWSGAEGGMQTVAGSVAIAFLPDTTATSTGGTGSATVPTCGTGDCSIPDVGMADQFQSSSAFNGLYRGVTYPNVTESPNSPVGIVPFKFCANKGAPAGLTNLTFQSAKALYGAGALPLSFFTGNSADETKTVVATGRDPDSGTRLNASAEIGLGPQASIKHWEPLDSAGNLVKNALTQPIDHFTPWPASVINGIPIAVFNGGYSSGGDLSKMLANTSPAGFTVISYASVNDVDLNSIPNGAPELSWNGVLLGNTGGNYNNVPAMTEGKYTFWCYEHLNYRAGTPSAVAAIADAVALQIRNVDAPIFLSSMKCQRATDGSVVFPSYNTVPPPQ